MFDTNTVIGKYPRTQREAELLLIFYPGAEQILKCNNNKLSSFLSIYSYTFGCGTYVKVHVISDVIAVINYFSFFLF